MIIIHTDTIYNSVNKKHETKCLNLFEPFFFSLFLDWENKTLNHKLPKSVPVAPLQIC